jgi:hypothetical protein
MHENESSSGAVVLSGDMTPTGDVDGQSISLHIRRAMRAQHQLLSQITSCPFVWRALEAGH